MFNIGLGELVILLLIAFVVVGPEDLPKVARALAKILRSMRTLFSGAKEAVMPPDETEELASLAKELNETVHAAREATPISQVKRELDTLNPVSDLKKDLDDVNRLLHKSTH